MLYTVKVLTEDNQIRHVTGEWPDVTTMILELDADGLVVVKWTAERGPKG